MLLVQFVVSINPSIHSFSATYLGPGCSSSRLSKVVQMSFFPATYSWGVSRTGGRLWSLQCVLDLPLGFLPVGPVQNGSTGGQMLNNLKGFLATQRTSSFSPSWLSSQLLYSSLQTALIWAECHSPMKQTELYHLQRSTDVILRFINSYILHSCCTYRFCLCKSTNLAELNRDKAWFIARDTDAALTLVIQGLDDM